VILAIDSSTAWMGVGLYDETEGVVVEERIWRGHTNHCRLLLPEVDAALRAHGLTRPDIGAIAVAGGPGTFNGVRVGVTTAKLIAYALGRPVVGVDTLEVHAAGLCGLVRPLLDAARGEVATALFRDGRRLEDDRIASTDELFVEPDEPTLFVGELKPAWRAALERVGGRASVATPAQCLRRPGVLAELAARRLARGESDDAKTLVPLYLRQPHITPPRVAGKNVNGAGRTTAQDDAVDLTRR
jgi:tRNA threonylcarbamoyladenosine biosynthesis protein TsaB